ncbi:MAG: DUF1549 domain-containing protein, partial [Planctomycetales bacterium]|nr:DUF1549 domain-containing protein [Planctomycetales bacterium]
MFRSDIPQKLSFVFQNTVCASLVSLAIFNCVTSPAVGETASSQSAASPISFELDVQPVLTSNGCNAGPCHGKARGQNGFQLSLLGFDSEFDFDSITKEGRGRRVFPASPASSLLLKKATGQLPHGGGVRFDPDSDEYQILAEWIRQGTLRRVDGEPTLERIELSDSRLSMRPDETHSLQVTAHYSDGTTRNVTKYTAFQSNEAAIVGIDKQGLITAGQLPGEATMMARYMMLIATCDVLIPLEETVSPEVYQALPRSNFIDGLVWDKLQTLNLIPSEPIDDAKFLRRASVDIIGRLPTPAEVRQFLADTSETKRADLVDRLVNRPEFADHWSNKWVDLLRPNPYRVGIKTVLNYDRWIRDAFRKNKPYDQFVSELVTAQGSTFRNGAVTLYRDRRSPDEVATLISRLFLGIRLECAKCHHHPFEKWSQHDFYSFAAYFAKVGRKGTGLSPPISGSEEMILVSKTGDVTHPITGEKLDPKALFGDAAVTENDTDPRQALARWMTSPDNDYFAQVMANRVWADMMGRGIVEPVDDIRATNPPSNGPLLKALGDEFRRVDFDLKELVRTIANSYVYGLSSLPNERNVSDNRNYSRHYRKRLRAEVMLDAITEITGVDDSFQAMPSGARSTQLWTHRIDSVFLDTFGRPDANQDPPCERMDDTTVTQSLHLMNAPQIQQKLSSDAGTVAELAKSPRSNQN